MREIKFRAWDESLNTFHMFDLSNERGEMIPVNLMGVPRGLKLNQFTGLKDKNEKEIYFGDLVSIKGNSPTVGKVDRVKEIKDWGDVVCEFGLENAQEAKLLIDVIGNKYEGLENPELLK